MMSLAVLRRVSSFKMDGVKILLQNVVWEAFLSKTVALAPPPGMH